MLLLGFKDAHNFKGSVLSILKLRLLLLFSEVCLLKVPSPVTAKCDHPNTSQHSKVNYLQCPAFTFVLYSSTALLVLQRLALTK
jgi:hypothetical protein